MYFELASILKNRRSNFRGFSELSCLSSQEHEVFNVSYWDQSMSVVVRRQFALNVNSSYTTKPILTRLHRNDLRKTLYKIAKINLIRHKNMAFRGVGVGFILPITVKIPTITIVGILTSIKMINTTSERLKARHFFVCRYLSLSS